MHVSDSRGVVVLFVGGFYTVSTCVGGLGVSNLGCRFLSDLDVVGACLF